MCRDVRTLSICPTCDGQLAANSSKQWCRDARRGGRFGRCNVGVGRAEEEYRGEECRAVRDRFDCPHFIFILFYFFISVLFFSFPFSFVCLSFLGVGVGVFSNHVRCTASSKTVPAVPGPLGEVLHR
ncbi:hypothetical protein F4802DRAFT_415935 [Xylaria palmicola]|nr:hypothetical protein F4802DRAFT_415935 [Xylaria palmicola]